MIKSPRTGWTGKILHVDLEKQHCDVETPDTDFYRQTTGGKGMGGYYLRHFAGFAWDHPAMVLCLFTGPLTGTTAPTSGRAHLVTRSPLTGLIGDSSVGGKLATQLKRAGWDGIVITGKSKTPAGLIINNDTVTFKDASELWGQDTQSVFRNLNPGKASLSCIGPAAENGVRFASVTTDRHHAAGRSGLGLSFACKNLKYILVNGTGRVTIHDPSGLKQAREEIIRLSAASPALMGKYGFTNLGTGAVFDLISNRRMMPTDNFKRTWFDSAGALNAPAYARTYAPEKYGCLGCHILCKKLTLKNGNRTALPEFETMSHFSALIGSRDLELVVEANTRCNTLGMDTISAASTLACRREITGEAFTPESLLRLLDDMAYGRGEGKLLALGSRAYAQAVGAPECTMTVKSLELPAYDPRGAYGMALGYAVSTRGGCHLRAYPISHEILRKPVATDRFSFSGKARIIKIAEDMNAMVDSLIACKFMFFAASLEEYAKAYTAVTGDEAGAHDLLKKGERIDYNERIINFINGADPKEDDLPRRFFKDPGSSGNQILIPPIDRQDFLKARQRYYSIRGLDDQGRPTKEKANSLGLQWTDL